jgi:hypothetical protein
VRIEAAQGPIRRRHTVAWENRKGLGRYFTLSRRCGGRTVRTYFGTGQAAELAATTLEIRHIERTQAQRAEAEESSCWKSLEDQLQEYATGADLLARLALLLAGYYEHRGEWRRRRNATKDGSRPGGGPGGR